MSLIGIHYTEALFDVAYVMTAENWERLRYLARAKYGHQWERLAAADLAMARYAIHTIQHAA